MRKFYLSQLWFLIPGLILMVTSVWVPLDFAYKQIFWNRTEALILEQIIEYPQGEEGEAEVYLNLEFTDANGKVQHLKDNSDDDYMEGSDEKHLILYYDPSNPADYVLANFGRYLIVIFVPFAWFLLYLGWPNKEEVG